MNNSCKYLFLIFFLYSYHAFAFVCNRDGGFGPSLYWNTRILPMKIAHSGNKTNDLLVLDSFNRAISHWNNVKCSDFMIYFAGFTKANWVGCNWHKPEINENVIVIRNANEWFHSPKFLANTTVTYMPGNGKIVDADIEINWQHVHDVKTLTTALMHEIGHVLGLEHCHSTNSIMQRSMDILYNNHINNLGKDDIDALCFLYPKNNPIAGEYYGVKRENRSKVTIYEQNCQQTTNQSNFCLLGIFLWLGVVNLAKKRHDV